MSVPKLINMAIFQAGWFACLMGLTLGTLIAVPLALGLHYLLVSRDRAEWILILAGTLLGLSMDMSWQRLGLIEYAGLLGAVPLWLAGVWVLFMTTLAHSLSWLQRHLGLAALAGAVAAPLSYWAGLRLGAASTRVELWQLLVVIAAGWATLLPFLVFMMREVTSPLRQQEGLSS